jgi:hypothetical protein
MLCNDHFSSVEVSKTLFDRDGEVFKRMNPILMRHIQEGGRVPWQKPEGR